MREFILRKQVQYPINSGIEPQHSSVTSRNNVRLINMLWPKHYSVVRTFDILVLLRSNTTVVHFDAKPAQPANDKIPSIVLTFSSVYNLRYKVRSINLILQTPERQSDLQ